MLDAWVIEEIRRKEAEQLARDAERPTLEIPEYEERPVVVVVIDEPIVIEL